MITMTYTLTIDMMCGICGKPVLFTLGQEMRCPHCHWRLWMKDEHGTWTSIMTGT